MNLQNEQDILQSYISAASKHGDATLVGDYKTANTQNKILTNVYKFFEKDRNKAEKLLEFLFQCENPSVRGWAAAHALGLRIKIDEATEILRTISKDHQLGILRFDAEMTLSEWEKKGELHFYH
jgi:hypothetical protein